MHSFKPGQSSNPSGRAKDMVGHIVRTSDTDEKCCQLPVDAVEGKLSGIRARDRILAAQYPIDRAYGKAPPQEIIHGQADIHTGVFDHLPMPKLQALMKVLEISHVS